LSQPHLSVREYAYLSIRGPGTHESISELIGLCPSEAWNVGDIDRNGRPRKFMTWELHSGLEDHHPMNQHIDNVLLFLYPRSELVKQLWFEYEIYLHCVGYYPCKTSSPGFYLGRDQVRQAALLGIAIDCDFYYIDDFGHEA